MTPAESAPVTDVLLILLGYLAGSVPTGFLIGYVSGVDVRRSGSGNVGATNVARVLGKKRGLITLLVDVLKGLVPAALAVALETGDGVASLVGLAAFLGHLYPVFLRFRGGKGVATAFGVFLAVAPWSAAAMIGVFVTVAITSRLVSLASMAAAVSAPAWLWLFYDSGYLTALGLLLGVGVVLRHRENIQRLRAGTEPRFSIGSR